MMEKVEKEVNVLSFLVRIKSFVVSELITYFN